LASEPTVCTIIAKNYLAFARTLCNSFLEQHPEGKCFVLVIDSHEGYIDPGTERFQVVRVEELRIQGLKELCFRYNITELSTALKPFLIEHLLRNTPAQKVLYLDPDILVTAPLHHLYEELDRWDVILTPHLDKDYPEDGLFPDDSHVLRSGIYNLGFIGMRKCGNVFDLLAWWRGKVSEKCVIDHGRGYFVDQRFIDLATTLFRNIAPVLDPGYNVAYWNLHSRAVGVQEGRWTCGEGPLYFFHFSDYKPEYPDEISGHQTRFALADLCDLRALFDLYRCRLIENDYSETRKWPYTYGYFEDGSKVNDLFRKIYRISKTARRNGNPFDRSGYTAGIRMLLPVTSIIHVLLSFAKDRVKASPLSRRLLQPIVGPLPRSRPAGRQEKL
jgi:hypothetical protein